MISQRLKLEQEVLTGTANFFANQGVSSTITVNMNNGYPKVGQLVSASEYISSGTTVTAVTAVNTTQYTINISQPTTSIGVGAVLTFKGPSGNIVKDDESLFTGWGHNYFRPRNQLIEDLWDSGFTLIESDLSELSANGSNLIRICLQLNKFMDSKTTVNVTQLNKLYAFCDLAAKYDLYVIVNGANAWDIANQPDWLTLLNESDRWLTQANFWRAVATKIGSHPAVAWYSLINKPIDQNNNLNVVNYDLNDDGSINYLQLNILNIDNPAFNNKFGNDGYAILSNNNNISFVYYENIYFIPVYDETGDIVNSYDVYLQNVVQEVYGDYSLVTINETNYSQFYVSLINKIPDINNLQISNINSSAKTAIIDLASAADFKTFAVSETSSKTSFGFVGTNYSSALKDPSNVNGGGDDFSSTSPIGITAAGSRFTKSVSSSYSLTEINHAVSGATLNTTNVINNVATGYGQVLRPYNKSSGSYYSSTHYNNNKINSVNFGLNDFFAYGTPYGYNSDFFIQTLRVILSRLRSESVTEFSGLSGFTLVDSSVSPQATNSSGGSYQKTTTSKIGASKVSFSTPYDFPGGTVAIGFMVESEADASAKISVNNYQYYQGLQSGVDTLTKITAPVVKRIHNLPQGINQFDIELTVNLGSACLDYWQVESLTPSPIIVHSIPSLTPTAISISGNPTASGTIYTYTTAIDHNLMVGESVIISGITAGTNYAAFNGTFTVSAITGFNTFQVVGSTSNPTATSTLFPSVIPNYSQGAIALWNKAIANLIFGEFFDGSVVNIDMSKVLTSSTHFAADKTNLTNAGHAAIASGYVALINGKNLNKSAVSVNNNELTYTTSEDHNLRIGDVVVIKNASPAACNGAFEVSAVDGTNVFSIVTPSTITNPSIISAQYANCKLNPNSVYFINTNSTDIPSASRVLFSTDDIVASPKVGSDGRYTISLSNSTNVVTNAATQSCLIKNPLLWCDLENNADQEAYIHYSTYITLTPNGRDATSIAQSWINQMVAAIRTTDAYTPVTLGTISLDPDGAVGTGFGFNNTKDLLDIISPHQYLSTSVTDAVASIQKCASEGHPVILEEGALPHQKSPRITANYLLKSKKYLAGVLNDYRSSNWSSDPNLYQFTFSLLKPFMSDAPSNDANKTVIDYNSLTNFLTFGDNKPRVTGRRYLTPIEDPIVNITSISQSSDLGSLKFGTYKYIVTAILDDNNESLGYLGDSLTLANSRDINLTWKYADSSATVNRYLVYREGSANSGAGNPYTNYFCVGKVTSKTFTDQGATFLRCEVSSSGNNPGWTSSDKYVAGNFVFYNSVYYKCKNAVGPSNNAPSSDTSNWQALANNSTVTIGLDQYSTSLRLPKTLPSESNSDFLYSDFPSSGVVLVNGEYIRYTGTQDIGFGFYLTGLTRGYKNSTIKTTGDGVAVYPVANPIDFTFVENDSLAPSDYLDIKKSGSYLSETQLSQSPSTLPQSSFMYLNTIAPSKSNVKFILNDINLGTNRTLNTVKTIANLKSTKSGLYGFNLSTSSLGSYNSNWYSTGVSSGVTAISDLTKFVAFTNALNSNLTVTTTLSQAVTSSSQNVFTVNNASSFPASGVIRIGSEFATYIKNSNTSLAIGRGVFNSTAASSYSIGTTLTLLNAAYTSSATPSALSWKIDTSALDSGSEYLKMDLYINLFVNPTNQIARIGISSVDTSAPTNATGDGGLVYLALRYRGSYVTPVANGATAYNQGDLVYYNDGGSYNGIYKNWVMGPTYVKGITSSTGGYLNPVSHNCYGTAVTSGTQYLNVSTTSDVLPGMLVTGSSGLTDGTYVQSIFSSTRVVLNQPLAADIGSSTDQKALNFRGWTRHQNAPTVTNGLVGLKIPLTLDATTNYWQTNNGTYDITLPYQNIGEINYFSPSNFRISVASLGTTANSFVVVGPIYANNLYYKYGSTDADGTQVMTTKFDQSNAIITLNNNSGSGWFQSSEQSYTISNIGFNSPKLSFNINDDSNYASIDSRNVVIYTGYVEAKLTESLSPKGSPVATIV